MIAMGPAKLDGSDIVLPVTGGTGRYAGAHGQLTSTSVGHQEEHPDHPLPAPLARTPTALALDRASERSATLAAVRSFALLLAASVAFLGLAASGSARPQTTNPGAYVTVRVTVTDKGVTMSATRGRRGSTAIFLLSNQREDLARRSPSATPR